MTTSEVTLDTVLALARRLPPTDQARLIARLAPSIAEVLDHQQTSAPPLLRGLLADLGPAPSAAEINDVQREMWAPFARDSEQ